MAIRFKTDHVYYAFDIDAGEIHIEEVLCVNQEWLHFNVLSDESHWTDSQYDDYEAARKFVFRTLKECKRGAVRYVFKEEKL